MRLKIAVSAVRLRPRAPFVLFHPSASVHGSPKSLRNVGFGCRAVSRSPQSSLVTGQIIGLDGGIMHPRDRKSVVSGESVSVRVELGGRRITKKQNTKTKKYCQKEK